MLIVFDIDGTLADLSHRLKHIKEEPKNWAEFHRRCTWDEPIAPMIALCNTLMADTTHDVVFVSGRNEAVRERTVEWLDKKLSFPENFTMCLYMRAEDDHRPDYKVKLEILLEVVALYGKKPDLVFDDRQQVVDMWREHGIRVCQVADGNY